MNSLDVVDQWTQYIREHPAEGFALFHSCEGITEFISGREVIVRGLTAVDNSTIRIKFASPDAAALERLRNYRALPPGLKLGRYWLKSSQSNSDLIAANDCAIGEKPFLSEATIRRGGDVSPLVSFSPAVTTASRLWNSGDIRLCAQQPAENGAALLPIGRTVTLSPVTWGTLPRGRLSARSSSRRLCCMISSKPRAWSSRPWKATPGTCSRLPPPQRRRRRN